MNLKKFWESYGITSSIALVAIIVAIALFGRNTQTELQKLYIEKGVVVQEKSDTQGKINELNTQLSGYNAQMSGINSQIVAIDSKIQKLITQSEGLPQASQPQVVIQ